MKFLLDPVINFFRALPPIALIPLVIVYAGIGEFARISVLPYASFFAAIVVLYETIVASDPIYVRAARAMGDEYADSVPDLSEKSCWFVIRSPRLCYKIGHQRFRCVPYNAVSCAPPG